MKSTFISERLESYAVKTAVNLSSSQICFEKESIFDNKPSRISTFVQWKMEMLYKEVNEVYIATLLEMLLKGTKKSLRCTLLLC